MLTSDPSSLDDPTFCRESPVVASFLAGYGPRPGTATPPTFSLSLTGAGTTGSTCSRSSDPSSNCSAGRWKPEDSWQSPSLGASRTATPPRRLLINRRSGPVGPEVSGGVEPARTRGLRGRVGVLAAGVSAGEVPAGAVVVEAEVDEAPQVQHGGSQREAEPVGFDADEADSAMPVGDQAKRCCVRPLADGGGSWRSGRCRCASVGDSPPVARRARRL